MEVSMIRRKFVLFLILSLTVSFSLPSYAQESLSRRPSESYYPELSRILGMWNQRKFKVPKNVFTDRFISEIREQASTKVDTWETSRITLWKSLPDELIAQRRLSLGAQQLLTAMYSQNASEFRAEYRTDAAREYNLVAKLYLILSLAQDYALESGTDEIQPSDVFAAMMQAFTGLWPFCPRKRKPVR
jgi:hypothetical protein